MSKRVYEEWKPKADTLYLVSLAVEICEEYANQGYDLTLRQLYYQFVSRYPDLMPNNMKSYNRLKSIVTKARMAGMLDWNHIVDRTRNLQENPHWNDPPDIIEQAARGYAIDKWEDQSTRVEVWCEKEALAGVIERASRVQDVSWFSCKGYVSQSEQWRAAQRHLRYLANGQAVVVLYLGDHDPSGLDMTRDIRERLQTFRVYDWIRMHPGEDWEGANYGMVEAAINRSLGRPTSLSSVEIRRIALNMDQVREYDPPPNPAKLTDSRVDGYMAEHGNQSWELDALDPTVLVDLVRDEVEEIRDSILWDARVEQETAERITLTRISDQYDEVVERLTVEED